MEVTLFNRPGLDDHNPRIFKCSECGEEFAGEDWPLLEAGDFCLYFLSDRRCDGKVSEVDYLSRSESIAEMGIPGD